MKKILHIVKKKDDPVCLEVIGKQAGSNDLSVILIQDAVDLNLNGTGTKIFVLSDDLTGSKKAAYPKIGYKEMLDAILNAETVVTW